MGGSAGAADGGQGGSGGSAGAPYSPCPTNGTACAIMPLGDSITFGTTYAGSYRVELFQLALTNSQNITFVGSKSNGPSLVGGVAFPPSNEGHSGYDIDTTDGGWGLYPTYTKNIPMYKPNIILLMIGTNDINNNVQVTNAPTRLGNFLDQITLASPQALVVVAQIIPTETASTNTKVSAYNAAIPGVVQQRIAAGKHLMMVDMYDPFASNANYQTEYMHDNLHPNQAGFTVMANTWYAAIKGLLPAKKP